MPQPVPFWKNPIIVLVLCTLMILISYGTRQSFGLFLIPISDAISPGRVEPFSFAVSLQTLIIGLSVPFVSMIADKWLGPIKMLVIGGALYALGIYLLSNATAELHLFWTLLVQLEPARFLAKNRLLLEYDHRAAFRRK